MQPTLGEVKGNKMFRVTCFFVERLGAFRRKLLGAYSFSAYLCRRKRKNDNKQYEKNDFHPDDESHCHTGNGSGE